MDSLPQIVKRDLLRIIRNELGDHATAEEIIDYLSDTGALSESAQRQHVIGVEFFRIMGEPNGRLASDIDQELAARYEVGDGYVWKIRSKYKRIRVNMIESRRKNKIPKQ